VSPDGGETSLTDAAKPAERLVEDVARTLRISGREEDLRRHRERRQQELRIHGRARRLNCALGIALRAGRIATAKPDEAAETVTHSRLVMRRATEIGQERIGPLDHLVPAPA
jgi:hypothetical protein